jgi:hypothetical protein
LARGGTTAHQVTGEESRAARQNLLPSGRQYALLDKCNGPGHLPRAQGEAIGGLPRRDIVSAERFMAIVEVALGMPNIGREGRDRKGFICVVRVSSSPPIAPV